MCFRFSRSPMKCGGRDDVFLMGFLLSGVLADYKESERLPGELAASIETITDEVETLWETKRVAVSRDCRRHLLTLVDSISLWFRKKQSTTGTK